MKKPKNKLISRRQVFAFCFFLLGNFTLAADKNLKVTCRVEKIYPTEKSALIDDIKSFILPPHLYYYTEEEWDKEKRLLTIFKTNADNAKRDSIILSIPEDIIIHYLPKIAIAGDYLILTDDNYFDNYRFEKTGDTFAYRNSIAKDDSAVFSRILFLKDHLFLFYSIYNQHPEDKKYNTNLAVYDAKSNRIVSYIHPELPCIGFSHMTSHRIAVNENTIALASLCDYKIDLYDFNLKQVGGIHYQPENNWNTIPGNELPFECNTAKIHPKILIDSLLIFKHRYSRIENIYFLNNNTLLVSSSGKNMGDTLRRIDLWNIKNPAKPFFTDSKAKMEFTDTDIIVIDKLPLLTMNAIDFSIQNNSVYSITDTDFYPVQNITLKEFNHKKNLHYEKYDPKYSIGIYKISLP